MTAAAVLRFVRPAAAGPDAAPRATRLRLVHRADVPALVRSAVPDDASAIHALIEDNLEEGRLLPREVDEIAAHAGRFLVITNGSRLLACAELAPLDPDVAEIRSLVVDRGARGTGLGRTLVDALTARAADAGIATVCAFAHAPAFFTGLGFTVVPHDHVPAKIAADCVRCPRYGSGAGQCGQFAVVRQTGADRAEENQR